MAKFIHMGDGTYVNADIVTMIEYTRNDPDVEDSGLLTVYFNLGGEAEIINATGAQSVSAAVQLGIGRPR